MAVVDVKVPAVGESVKEGMIHRWHKKSGEFVARDEVLLELETDKATVEVVAESAGTVTTLKKEGDTVAVGEVVAKIDTAGQPSAAKTETKSAPQASEKKSAPAPAASAGTGDLSPAVRRMTAEHGISPAEVEGTGRGGRLTKTDVVNHLASGAPAPKSPQTPAPAASKSPSPPPAMPVPATRGSRTERREPMSMLRRRIAERLVHAQSTAAILTTFNEIDMTAVMALRSQYKDAFKERYGISLGFMSFFVRAAVEALKAFPQINGWIEGNDIVFHDYYDIGVAVSSDRGLVVPVVRDVDHLSFAQTEQAIGAYARKARDGKITVDDLSGGTFTVSNGGVFGSLLSTPILNPPQSAILGMHKIEERPIALNGQVVIRPMMYVALSYDHRIVDGKEAVQFLVKIKECVEDPNRLLIGV
jgi:2-oxoglutarate dehydrogenase E2 component (dihydrolipoamide succinyltransferase)